MVMPVRHVGELEELDADEAAGLWRELAGRCGRSRRPTRRTA